MPGAERDIALKFDYMYDPAAVERLGLEPSDNVACMVGAHVCAQGASISYSRNPDFYHRRAPIYGPAFNRRSVVEAADTLDRAGLIFNEVAPRNSHSGRQSRMWANPELLDACPPSGLTWVPRYDVVELRDVDKRPIRFPESPLTKSLRCRTCELNEIVRHLRLDFPGYRMTEAHVIEFDQDGRERLISLQKVAVRIFNERFDHGGRFYAAYQNVPRALRALALLQGQPIAICDFRSLHVQMLYDILGREMPADPYQFRGFSREVGKGVVNILINAMWYEAEGAVAGKIAAERHKLESGEDHDPPSIDPHRDDASRLISMAKEKHEPIVRFFGSRIGAKLQFHDSQILSGALIHAARDGVIALHLHDAMLTQGSSISYTKDVMQDHYMREMRTSRPCDVSVSYG